MPFPDPEITPEQARRGLKFFAVSIGPPLLVYAVFRAALFWITSN